MVLMLWLEALCRTNQVLLRLNPDLPDLITSGVAYVDEGPGGGIWRDIRQLLVDGHGNCEELACARVAELRERDGDLAARPALTAYRRPDDTITYHVFVRRGDGYKEDPSEVLGMRRAAGWAGF
jgi:hypothetical protein